LPAGAARASSSRTRRAVGRGPARATGGIRAPAVLSACDGGDQQEQRESLHKPHAESVHRINGRRRNRGARVLYGGA